MRRSTTFALVLAALQPHLLLAAPANCNDTATPGSCRLAEFLSWLHFAAIALAILLVAVVVITLRIVLCNRRENDPLSPYTTRERR